MSEHYNYMESMTNAGFEYAWEARINMDRTAFTNRETMFETLCNLLSDILTREATCQWEAEDYLCHNWPLLRAAADELEVGLGYIVRRGPIYADSLIRRYLLNDVIQNIQHTLEARGDIAYINATV